MTADPADPLLPLLLATALLLGSAIIPRLPIRWPLWLRVGSRLGVLLVMTLLVQRVVGSPVQPLYHHGRAGEQFWEQLIVASWWVAVARVVAGFARLLVVLEHRPRETRILSDLSAGAIYIAATLAIINFAFAVPVRGLLATSGVIAIVLGLALQSTLSDVFSGIAVGLERPYKPGDLLWVEGGIEGHVIQVSWRSTQIATAQNNIAVVPNSIIAKARLINRSAPSPVRGDSLAVNLDASVAPERCLGALRHATLACRVMLAEPAPVISCTELRGDGATYEIGFSVADTGLLAAARTELLSQIHRHLRHGGIALGVTGLPAPPPVTVPDAGELLRQSDLFGLIAPEERALLANRLTPQTLDAGEVLIREGEAAEALFLLASGVVEVTRDGADGPRLVYRLSPGESLGAIGLITGTPNMATATTLTPVLAWRLGREDIAAAIKANPDLQSGLEALATRSRERIRRDAAAREHPDLEQPEVFLSRLRNFLRRVSG